MRHVFKREFTNPDEALRNSILSEIAEVKMQGTRDDLSIGTSTPLDGNMWKRKLRHVLGEDVLRVRDDTIIHTRIPDWKYAARGAIEKERLMHMPC